MANIMIKKLKVAKYNKYWALMLSEGEIPNEIFYTNKGRNIIKFESGEESIGTCINCEKKPCATFGQDEIDIEILKGLPYNTDRRVCPSNAIQISENCGIIINPEMCIGCGICISRCPVGGIYFIKDGTHVDVGISSSPTWKIIKSRTMKNSITFNKFKNIKTTYSIDKITIESARFFRYMFLKLSKSNSDLELIMIRNYLISLGVYNKISAKGTNDTRLDFLGLIDNKLIPGESELTGNDILGLPRRMLDDVAVLHSRYGVRKEDIIPVVVIFLFPRKRSDFYEVMSDIEKITGIKIRTLTVHFLKILTLLGIGLSLNDLKEYFVINKDNQDFGKYTKRFITNIEKIDENYGTDLYTFGK